MWVWERTSDAATIAHREVRADARLGLATVVVAVVVTVAIIVAIIIPIAVPVVVAIISGSDRTRKSAGCKERSGQENSGEIHVEAGNLRERLDLLNEWMTGGSKVSIKKVKGKE